MNGTGCGEDKGVGKGKTEGAAKAKAQRQENWCVEGTVICFFYTLLDLMCKYFVQDCCIYVHKRYASVVFLQYCCLVLVFRVMLDSSNAQNELGRIPFAFVFWKGLFCCGQSLSYLTLCHLMDYSPPGSSAHGTFQARALEWVAISSSRGSSWPRDRTQVFHSAGGWGLFTSGPPGKPKVAVENW